MQEIKWKKNTGEYKDWPVVFGSIDALKEIMAVGPLRFVWPEECEEAKSGGWMFNIDHDDFQPLLVDAYTASMLVQIHDKLSPERQGRFADQLEKSRGYFGYWIESGWKLVNKGNGHD